MRDPLGANNRAKKKIRKGRGGGTERKGRQPGQSPILKRKKKFKMLDEGYKAPQEKDLLQLRDIHGRWGGIGWRCKKTATKGATKES